MAEIEVEDTDLSALIADEIRQAQTFDQSKRTLAIEYMRGEMSDLPARVNGSSQTSRDVADTLSWILPGVVRVFTASDQMVEFEATQEGGEQGAEEAGEYTNYSFFRENDGYRILYNATYDSLLMGNGAACSYWEPEQSKVELHRDKTKEEITLLLEEGWKGIGVPLKPGKPRTVQMDDPMSDSPIEMEIPTYTARLQIVTARGQIRDMTCKPENLLLNSTATTIEDARMVAYLHDDKTRSDLVAMADEYGWDKAVIEDLAADNLRNANEVSAARQAERAIYTHAPLKSGDPIDLYEVYIRADANGDGIAEMLQVWYAGNAGSGEILSYDEWEDDVPFTDIPCYPVPHQWVAESVYDRTADIQRVKTVLLRQGIENLYAVNQPMREVEAGSVENPDILTNPKFGGLIWKKKGTAPIIPHVVPYIGDKAFAALEYMDTLISKRTGVSKTTMALDPEALQNQTATSSQLQHDAGYSQIELIARNMAELGWAKFFAKRRNLAKKYIKDTIKIPSKNGDKPPAEQMQQGMAQPDAGKPSDYRTIQPEKWSDDMACTINVGLGTGSRDRDMSMLTNVMNTQIAMTDRLAQFGFATEALDFFPKVIKTATQIAESAGMKNPDSYYPIIDDQAVAKMKEQASQPKPDPALALEEAKAKTTLQVEQGKLQFQMQLEQAKMQAVGEAESLASEAQVRREQAQLNADLQTKEADRQNALSIAREQGQIDLQKQANDLAFKQWEAEFNANLEREKMANAVTVAKAKPKPQPSQPST